MNKRFICFVLAALMLAVTLGFTSCGPNTMPTASAASSGPVWHITVHSPGIDEYMRRTSREPKYTVTVDSLDEVFEIPYCKYGMLTIHRDDGRIELVPVSLVEIEYY